MLQEKIEITNYHKEKLVGLLTTVNNDKKLIIVCHGFALDKEKTPVQELCKAISNQGYNCFRFDFSGCGESEGEFGSSHYTKQSDDLASVINHFDVDSYKIKGVIGHSMGGSVAILQARATLPRKSPTHAALSLALPCFCSLELVPLQRIQVRALG